MDFCCTCVTSGIVSSFSIFVLYESASYYSIFLFFIVTCCFRFPSVCFVLVQGFKVLRLVSGDLLE